MTEDHTSVLQDDLRDMLIALGKSDSARPQSPHEVFRECIEDVKRLRAALEPFAKCEMTRPDREPDHWPAFGKRAGEGWPTVGDFRRAREALNPH